MAKSGVAWGRGERESMAYLGFAVWTHTISSSLSDSMITALRGLPGLRFLCKEKQVKPQVCRHS